MTDENPDTADLVERYTQSEPHADATFGAVYRSES